PRSSPACSAMRFARGLAKRRSPVEAPLAPGDAATAAGSGAVFGLTGAGAAGACAVAAGCGAGAACAAGAGLAAVLLTPASAGAACSAVGDALGRRDDVGDLRDSELF